MTQIETETTWDDSGYDCRHCGGRILKRTDRETGQPTQICLQCELCGCQWSVNGKLLRVGHTKLCRQAQREYEAERSAKYPSAISTRLLFLGGFIVLLLLVYFGGLPAIRFLIPVAIFTFVVVMIFRFGRDRDWW